MRSADESWWARWWAARAKLLGVNALIGCVLVIFWGGALGSKLAAAAFVFVVAALASMINVPKGAPPRSPRQWVSEVVERATGPMPPTSSLDPRRALLVAERNEESKPRVYLVVFPESNGVDPIFMLPWNSWRRRNIEFFADGRSLRKHIESRALGVAPQSDFTDEAARELFGADWRP